MESTQNRSTSSKKKAVPKFLDDEELETDDEEEEEDDEQEGEEGAPYLSPAEASSRTEENAKEDVFDYAHEYFYKKGYEVKYKIEQDSVLLGMFDHPLNWDDVQIKHGQGRYQVTAYSIDSTGRKNYVKQQTQRLKTPTKEQIRDYNLKHGIHDEVEENKKDETAEVSRQFMDKLESVQTNLMTKVEEQYRDKISMMEKIMEKNNNSQPDMASLIGALAQVMRPTENGEGKSTDLIMKIQEQNQKALEKQQEQTNKMIESQQQNTNSMIERLSHSIEKISEKVENKDQKSGPFDDPWKLVEMVDKFKTQGFEMRKSMDEIITEKSKELSESKGSDGPTEKLISMFAPIIAQAMSGNAGAAAPQTATPPNASTAPNGQLPASQSRPQRRAPAPDPKENPFARNPTPLPEEYDEMSSFEKASLGYSEDYEETDKNEQEKTEKNEEVSNDSQKTTETGSIKNTETIVGIVVPKIVNAYSGGRQDEDRVVEECLNEISKVTDVATVKRDFNESVIRTLLDETGLKGDLEERVWKIHAKLVKRSKELSQTQRERPSPRA